MALDALITAVLPVENGLRLTLGPRPGETRMHEDGTLYSNPESIPGQDSLLLRNPTWTPHVGDAIWGGAGFAQIVSGGISFPYTREGYTTLKQDW